MQLSPFPRLSVRLTAVGHIITAGRDTYVDRCPGGQQWAIDGRQNIGSLGVAAAAGANWVEITSDRTKLAQVAPRLRTQSDDFVRYSHAQKAPLPQTDRAMRYVSRHPVNCYATL